MSYKYIYILLFSLFTSIFSQSQSFNDGPIMIDVKLREVQGNFATDESL